MSDHPIVTTAVGDVRGFWRGRSAAFLGIPFAEPPVGELRFAAPVPRAGWPGVRDCLDHGPTPQRRPPQEVTAIPEPCIPGEDTLGLDVFTPRPGDSEARLPVYVWIHGGGYIAGSPASPWYDGGTFNREGVVTVNLSYRLGFDGFGWIADAPTNRGVLDWLCALEWVQANIAAFGGDPRRVTIGGQSAGGGAVLTLLGMPRAQHLFARAVSHSGAVADIPLTAAQDIGRKIAAECGVEPTVAALSTLTEEAILDAQDAVGRAAMGTNPMDVLRGMVAGEKSLFSFGPVVDGDLVPVCVPEALAGGVGADKRLLLGTTANEFNMATAQAKRALRLFRPAKFLHKRVGFEEDFAAAYVEAHPGMDTSEILGQLMTDTAFRAPLTRYAAARADAAGTWAFDFRWLSPLARSSPHCLDLPFAWDCLEAEGVEERNTGPNPPQAVADAMHAAWSRFVTDGDPGWARFEAPDHVAQVFDARPHTVTDAYAVERRLAERQGTGR